MAAVARALQAGGRPFEPGTAHPHEPASEAEPRPSHQRTTCARNGAVEALWKRGAARRSRGGVSAPRDGVPPRPASPTRGSFAQPRADAAVSSGPRSGPRRRPRRPEECCLARIAIASRRWGIALAARPTSRPLGRDMRPRFRRRAEARGPSSDAAARQGRSEVAEGSVNSASLRVAAATHPVRSGEAGPASLGGVGGGAQSPRMLGSPGTSTACCWSAARGTISSARSWVEASTT